MNECEGKRRKIVFLVRWRFVLKRSGAYRNLSEPYDNYHNSLKIHFWNNWFIFQWSFLARKFKDILCKGKSRKKCFFCKSCSAPKTIFLNKSKDNCMIWTICFHKRPFSYHWWLTIQLFFYLHTVAKINFLFINFIWIKHYQKLNIGRKYFEFRKNYQIFFFYRKKMSFVTVCTNLAF